MNLLHVAPAYDPASVYGGPIQSMHSLCRQLVKLGVGVDVLTTNANGNAVLDVPTDKTVERDGVRVTYCSADFLKPFIFSRRQWRTVRSRIGHYDLAHLHSVFTFSTLCAASHARERRIPYLITPHGSLVPDLVVRRGEFRKRMWLKIFDRKNLEQAAAVHLTSEHERSAMHDMRIAPFRDEIIPNGIEFPETDVAGCDPSVRAAVRKEWGIDENDRLILFLGRLTWEKGLALLVPAIAAVQKLVPEATLVLAGPDQNGYSRRLIKMAADAGISRRIVITGQLDWDRKWLALRECELLVLPSYSESFGLAALEASAAGKPVVVTKEVGVAPVLREAGAGVVTEVAPESLAAAITALLNNRGQSAAMGERGRKLVRERFLWPSVAKQMLVLYEDILRSVKRG